MEQTEPRRTGGTFSCAGRMERMVENYKVKVDAAFERIRKFLRIFVVVAFPIMVILCLVSAEAREMIHALAWWLVIAYLALMAGILALLVVLGAMLLGHRVVTGRWS